MLRFVLGADWAELCVALNNCSSSCRILLSIDLTSRVAAGSARVDALVELATDMLDRCFGTVGALLMLGICVEEGGS